MSRSYVSLASRGVVTVGGAERKTFLQALVSNDVFRVGPETALWAALLTPQGKYLHDFFIVETGEVLLLDCEAARLVDLGQRLHRYKLRADVRLDIGRDWAVFVLFGDAAADAFGLPAGPGSARAFGGGVVYVDPRLAEAGLRAVLPRDGAAAALEQAGFAAGSAADYERLRLELGLSDGSRDLVVEKAILLESNFDELNGVDWKKGCYVGQELTARTKYRGLVKRRLVPVDVEGPLPPPGSPVLREGKEVGEMRSGIAGRGLAVLRLEAIGEEGALTAGDARLLPKRPSWVAY